MAKVSNVTLSITSGNTSSTRTVTVGYKLAFEAAEVGGQYRVAIRLHGEDKPGDEEQGSLLSEPQLLYTYQFGSLVKKSYQSITAQAGEQSYTESRQVDRSKLNEDPGQTVKQIDINTTLKIPHPDEVFAVVNVAKEDRSATVQLL